MHSFICYLNHCHFSHLKYSWLNARTGKSFRHGGNEYITTSVHYNDEHRGWTTSHSCALKYGRLEVSMKKKLNCVRKNKTALKHI